MKLTKKQKEAIEFTRDDIKGILIESSLLAIENEWSLTEIEIRSTYDSFRILNLIHDALNNMP